MANAREIGGWIVIGIAGLVALAAFGDDEPWAVMKGAIVIAVVGAYFVRQGRAQRGLLLDEADLPASEQVLQRFSGGGTFIIVTAQRTIVRSVNLGQFRRQNYPNIPTSDKLDISLSNLEAANAVRAKDFLTGFKAVMAKVVPVLWGVQFVLRDGTVYNIPISDAEIVARSITKYLRAQAA